MPRASNKLQLKVAGLTDQRGRRWLRVAKGPDSAFLLAADLAANVNDAFKQLALQGVQLLSEPSRRELRATADRVTEWGPATIMDEAGWNGTAFALPDGLIGAKDDETVVTALANPAQKWGAAGSLKGWKKAIAQPLTGQPLGIFVVSLAFASALLEFFPQVENQGVELVGRPSSGKTTLLLAAASVTRGDPSSSIGGCDNWRVTDAGLERLLLAHRHLLLVLDEANAARGETAKQRGQALAEAVFTISQGRGRVRYTAGPTAEAARLLFLSSSNTPLLDLMDRSDTGRYEAVASRLITLPVSDGGVFKCIPVGYASHREAAEGLKKAAAALYGTAFRAFVAKLIKARRKDETALRANLEAMFEKRLADLAPDASGPEARIANAFALVAVAGLLAKRWEILPEAWKITASTKAVYRSHREWTQARAADDDPLGLVHDYYERHRDAFIDVTEGPAQLAATQGEVCLGFVRTTTPGRTELLFTRPQFELAFDPSPRRLLERLAACGALRREAGKNPKFSTKHRVYKGEGATRVYVIRIA